MSGGDSLEHECQTGVEDIFARMWFCFSCIYQTHKHSSAQSTNIQWINVLTKPE